MKGVRLSHIIRIADELFPFSEAEPWDNSGLQVGDPRRNVTSVAISLDPSPQSLRFAAERSCGLLITHHPLFLEPVKNLSVDTLTGRAAIEAARLDVAVLSLHTNLDAAAGGLNDLLAETLGLQEVRVPRIARCARIGVLPEPAPLAAFAREVGRRLHAERRLIVGMQERMVQEVFCAAGSGMGYLRDAVSAGADVMVTGDLRYHSAMEARELGMSIVDPGHYALEIESVTLLSSRFGSAFKELGFEIDCVEYRTDGDPLYILD